MTIINFSDTVSLQNALTTGAVDGAGTLDGSQIAALAAARGIRTVVSQSGSITPFTMRVDQAPFRDLSVRQALRLLVDRQQLINSALSGYGSVASDVFAPVRSGFRYRGYSDKISGYTAAKVGQPLSNFDFQHFAFV